MALTVETGTGSATADAYISEADATVYIAKFIVSATWIAASSAEKELAIRNATQYLDGHYTWRGIAANENQALAWPRQGATDDNNFLRASNTIPVEVVNACAELAERAINETLRGDLDAGSGIKSREAVEVGPISEDVSYLGGSFLLHARYPKVDGILKGLVDGIGIGVSRIERS